MMLPVGSRVTYAQTTLIHPEQCRRELHRRKLVLAKSCIGEHRYRFYLQLQNDLIN